MSAVRPLFVCIAGPTATGKTDAAVAVCRALDGEVVSMDSMQIYQGMDIGTAKPSPAEMSGVPHHMLDIVPPDRPYSVAEYQRDALRAAEEILARGKLPVFAGGTGLYLESLIRGTDFAAARRLGHTALHALSLPTVWAPETAGEALARTVQAILQEREGTI